MLHPELQNTQVRKLSPKAMEKVLQTSSSQSLLVDISPVLSQSRSPKSVVNASSSTSASNQYLVWKEEFSVPNAPTRKRAFPSPLLNNSLHSNCKQPHCEEFLSRTDRARKRSCLAKASKHFPLEEINSDNNCGFINGRERAPVALASAEGSGNTWVRGLLEKSSGVCTGFSFCDHVMRREGFIGENINSGCVLVVKTHMKMPQWIGSIKQYKYEANYGSAIFLLRNPYYSLIAEWNRRLTNTVMKKEHRPHNESHTNVAPKEIWCKYLLLMLVMTWVLELLTLKAVFSGK
jgi:hypothetical protein